jgi:hypothetical protein
MERKDVKKFLLNRKVRFINPWGEFDYADFGDFYFKGDVMMLITNDHDYTPYHKNDQLAHTLWSTVPVIFAGVDTGIKDDLWRDIYTGDVVSYQGYTSVVRYFGDSEFPGLIGDNCDILIEENGVAHKDGTAFVDVNPTMFKLYDPFFVHWAAGGFGQFGPSFEEIREKASVAMYAPTFIGGKLKRKRLLQIGYDEIEKVLTDNMILTYFIDTEPSEDENGELFYTILADNFPDAHHEKVHEIPMPDKPDLIQDLKEAFDAFLIYAHCRPEETFVLADFKEFFDIDSNYQFKVVRAFDEWYKFNIRNVILPSWIFFALVTLHGIGRD